MLNSVLAVFVFPLVTFQAGANLVPNGDFSKGGAVPDGWTAKTEDAGKLNVARDTALSVSVPASLRLESVGGPARGNTLVDLPDVSGKTLEVEAQLRSSGPTVEDAQLALFSQDNDYKMVLWKPAASRWDFKDGQWNKIKFTFTMPTNAKRSKLILLLNGDGKIWMDDVSVRDVSRPVEPTGTKSNLVDILPVTNQILAVHFLDGSIAHHKAGQKRGDDIVSLDPLDIATAMMPKTYEVLSESDVNFRKAVRPIKVGRKSKGADFAWFIDRWVNDHAENDRPDHIKEHWVYLYLPAPLKEGGKYLIRTGGLAKKVNSSTLVYASKSVRSETIHVNILGYAPASPAKFGYVYNWLGDQGGLDLKPWVGRKFSLIDQATKQTAFDGKVTFRKGKSTEETGQANQTPGGNYQQADVYECDFSEFNRPGRYVLSVEGIGSSFPFTVAEDVYREAFRTTARGLYHNRSGIELTKEFTNWTRPAPHNTKLTPGFAGRLKYTSSRSIDWKNSDNDPADKPAIEAGIKGSIDVAGWYQDAGDWDGYSTHMRVPLDLMLAYQMAPANYAPGELNIPESKNGLPDILNEAGWLPRFGARLRKALVAKGYGTGGVGLRVCGDHFGSDTGPNDVGRGSWQDVDRTWIVSGEDPVSTYLYAAAAAQMATCLSLAKKPDPEKIDWIREARESYAWAQKNTRPGDEAKPELAESRIVAAAALFVLTGERAYEDRFDKDTKDLNANSNLWHPAYYGPAIYALGRGPAVATPAIAGRIRSAILHTADSELEAGTKRSLRWGGDWYMPTLIGLTTTPWVHGLALGAVLTKESDPAKSKQYLGMVYTTCDYYLGNNPLNQTWVTGLGARSPVGVFHMDSWYSGNPSPIPGIVPYGPWRIDRAQGQGPWDKDWANKSLYPDPYQWPTPERWCNNRCSPMSGEFTIHQNTARAASLYGFLCAPKKP